jgi:hypothetical protein
VVSAVAGKAAREDDFATRDVERVVREEKKHTALLELDVRTCPICRRSALPLVSAGLGKGKKCWDTVQEEDVLDWVLRKECESVKTGGATLYRRRGQR